MLLALLPRPRMKEKKMVAPRSGPGSKKKEPLKQTVPGLGVGTPSRRQTTPSTPRQARNTASGTSGVMYDPKVKTANQANAVRGTVTGQPRSAGPVVRTSRPNEAPKLTGGGSTKPAGAKVLDLPARGSGNKVPDRPKETPGARGAGYTSRNSRGANDRPKVTNTDKPDNSSPATDKVKPNARVMRERADRATWVKNNPGKRYVRPSKATSTPPATGGGKVTTGGTGKTTTSRGSSAPKKTGVNKQTQAIRDDRAEAKSKGQVYRRSNEGLSAEAKKMRADAGVNEVLMNRRLTIRSHAKKVAAAKAKSDTPKDAETGNANAESEQQGNTQASNTTASTPPKVETEMEKARRLRKEAEAAAGK